MKVYQNVLIHDHSETLVASFWGVLIITSLNQICHSTIKNVGKITITITI